MSDNHWAKALSHTEAGIDGCLRIIGFIVLMFVCGALGLALFTIPMRTSDVAQIALDAARANPQVVQEMGEPIDIGLFITGSISTQGLSGNTNLSIPISGPKKNGMLYVAGIRANGTWQFYTLAVQVDGSNETIILQNEYAR